MPPSPSPSLVSPQRSVLEAVVLGGSAGSVDVLLRLLEVLPQSFALPLVVVVHQPPHASSTIASALARRCALPVDDADDKEPITPGRVYVAPAGYHLYFAPGPSVALSVDAPVRYSIPSIDVAFESAAEVCGARLAGVVLSGANDDGARGLEAICARGGIALVQDPREALSPTMPRAALARCPTARVLGAAALGRALVELSEVARTRALGAENTP